MATITITIPDDKVSRVLDAFAGNYGWAPSSGVSKARFARERVRGYIRDQVRAWEASQAAESARDHVRVGVHSQAGQGLLAGPVRTSRHHHSSRGGVIRPPSAGNRQHDMDWAT